MHAADCLGSDGALAREVAGFAARAQQQQMAAAVEAALADQTSLIVEAGTGTGKTFAYLLPALMSGRKTIISTGTKALQDQLASKDLPFLAEQLADVLRRDEVYRHENLALGVVVIAESFAHQELGGQVDGHLAHIVGHLLDGTGHGAGLDGFEGGDGHE